MPRGSEAKIQVKKKLEEAFGSDYIGEYSNKIYVWANDGGERVQIAISLTCPKTEVGNIDLTSAAGGGHDFSEPTIITAPTTSQPAEITKEEEQTIEDLIAALGL